MGVPAHPVNILIEGVCKKAEFAINIGSITTYEEGGHKPLASVLTTIGAETQNRLFRDGGLHNQFALKTLFIQTTGGLLTKKWRCPCGEIYFFNASEVASPEILTI